VLVLAGIIVAVRVMVLGALVLALVAVVVRMLLLVGGQGGVRVVAVAVVVQVMVLRHCCCRSCTLPLSSHVVGVVSLWHWPSVSPRRRRRVGVALAVCITSSSSRCCGCAVVVVSPWHLPWESRLRRLHRLRLAGVDVPPLSSSSCRCRCSRHCRLGDGLVLVL